MNLLESWLVEVSVSLAESLADDFWSCASSFPSSQKKRMKLPLHGW